MSERTLRLSTDDRDVLALASLRYAIGRQSYIVSDIANAIPNLRPTKHFCRVLIREIEEAPDLGSADDARRWGDLRRWLERQL